MADPCKRDIEKKNEDTREYIHAIPFIQNQAKQNHIFLGFKYTGGKTIFFKKQGNY